MTNQIHFDGGAEPTNPGIGYGSYEIITPAGSSLQRWKAPFTIKTNNEAEYLTLWLALKEYLLRFQSDSNLEIFSDSKLVVEQINGRWQVKHPNIKTIHSKIMALLRQIPHWQISWNSRDRNVERFGH